MSNKFKWQYTWKQCTRTTDATTGDRPKTFTDNGTLYGTEEVQSGTEETTLGAVRPVTYGQVRIRGFVDITALDRLQGGRFGTLYEIDGVRKNFENYQTICDVHSL